MNIKNLFFKIGSVVCSFAFMIAIQSLDQMCGGSFYQPKETENRNCLFCGNFYFLSFDSRALAVAKITFISYLSHNLII